MKAKILCILLFTLNITYAQNNLFKNISSTHQYTEYSSVKASGKGGKYIIKNKYAIVKFYKEYLPTGEGYKIEIIVDNEGEHKGKSRYLLDATTEGIVCKGQPYESLLTTQSPKRSFVAIDNYVFVLWGAEKDGVSFTKIDRVFIKNEAEEPKPDGKKKKKNFSFKEKLQALKTGGAFFGPEHKALQSQNIDKMITDYLVSMKAKQDARTPTELKNEKNLKIAKKKRVVKDIQAEKDEWAEAKRYNDSVKATPEYKDLERRKRQNELNYQSAQKRDVVTLHNNSSNTIYVGTSGSGNPGTKIRAGSTASWSCGKDAYIQTISSGGAYKSTTKRVYSKNTGCGKIININ